MYKKKLKLSIYKNLREATQQDRKYVDCLFAFILSTEELMNWGMTQLSFSATQPLLSS